MCPHRISMFSVVVLGGALDVDKSNSKIQVGFPGGERIIATYDLKFSCDNNIVDFFINGEPHSTLFKLGSNYEQCLN